MHRDWKWNRNDRIKFHTQIFIITLLLVITTGNVNCQLGFNGVAARRPQYYSNYHGNDQITFPDSQAPPGRFIDGPDGSASNSRSSRTNDVSNSIVE